MANARHDRDGQIGPRGLKQGRETVGKKQFIAAADQKRRRLFAAAERRQIIVRRAEIDREPERIDAGRFGAFGEVAKATMGNPLNQSMPRRFNSASMMMRGAATET